MGRFIKLILPLVLLVYHAYAFCQGIHFKPANVGSLPQITELERKPLFLLFGVHHCSWSTKSLAELKRDTTIDDFMNQHFVNVYFENKEEEIEFMQLFDIKDFPRYFIVTPAGEIRMMRSSYCNPKKIKLLASKVLKGKTLKPNLLMHTGGVYKKRKSTLKMLSHTCNAYFRLAQYGFLIRDKSTYSNLMMLSNDDRSFVHEEIQNSLLFGQYSTNTLLQKLLINNDILN